MPYKENKKAWMWAVISDSIFDQEKASSNITAGSGSAIAN